jgi:hypothetical protein
MCPHATTCVLQVRAVTNSGQARSGWPLRRPKTYHTTYVSSYYYIRVLQVCAVTNTETGERLAVKKVKNAFEVYECLCKFEVYERMYARDAPTMLIGLG